MSKRDDIADRMLFATDALMENGDPDRVDELSDEFINAFLAFNFEFVGRKNNVVPRSRDTNPK